MPNYRATIDSTWDRSRAFDFMSDFSNAREWDPGVVSAERHDTGAITPGSSFDLDVAFAGRVMKLRYVVRSMHAGERIVFVASTPRLESVDTLSFEERTGGCRMTYDADLRLKGIGALANPILALAFQRVGDRARDSLRSVLTSER